MSAKNVAALIIIAAVGGFILGRSSLQMGGIPGGAAPGGGRAAPIPDIEFAQYVLENPGPAATDAEAIPTAGAPFLGAASAKVTIVTFSDFQCPYCQRVGPSLQAVLDEYGDDVRIVFRNLPLSFHDRAAPAARAALAAHRQGQFWAYHDLIFNNFGDLSDGDLEGFAESLDLDMEQFARDLEDPEIAAQVDADKALANRLGFRGTPSFSINGFELVGAQPADQFLNIVADEIEAADALLDEGVPLSGVYARRVRENLAAAEGETGRAPSAAPSDALAVGEAR